MSFEWVDKVDGQDFVLAEDINKIGRETQKISKKVQELDNDATIFKNYPNIMANALKGTASGASVFLDDVSPVEHEMGVEVKSKNLLNKPFPSLTSRGVAFDLEEDGAVHVHGTNIYTTGDDGISYNNFYITLPKGTYVMSGTPDGGSRTTYYMVFAGQSSQRIFYDYGSGVTITLDREELCVIQLAVAAGMTVDFIAYPQLEEGTTRTSYTPYIEDLSTVKVVECGKNLLDAANGESPFGTHEIGADGVITLTNDAYAYKGRMIWELGSYDEFVGKTLTFSFTQLEAPAGGNIAYFYADYNTGNDLAIEATAVAENRRTTLTAQNIPANTGGWSKLQVVYYVDTFTTEGQIAKIKEPQVEFGSIATEYERGVEHIEHTVDATGAVKGIIGKGEPITLYTDTAGALIECKYNRDINKAFAELQAAIISLGGNI